MAVVHFRPPVELGVFSTRKISRDDCRLYIQVRDYTYV